MQLLAIASTVFAAFAAAVSPTKAEGKPLFARDTGLHHDSFLDYHPTSASILDRCDMRCQKYHCCYPWGECYCRAEALAEFEQFDTHFGNTLDNTSTYMPTLVPTPTPSPPSACDPRCNKYHCCNSFGGCNCLDEVLDELERAEKEGTALSIEAATLNINAADVDLGSDANANYKCLVPCGPAGAGCCWLGLLDHGRICACPKAQFPSLDQQNEAAARTD